MAVQCRVCGGDAPRHFSLRNAFACYPQTLEIHLCASCGLLFVGNELAPEDLNRFYRGVDWESYYNEVGATTQAKAEHAIDGLAHELERVGATLLDVGCGHGQFLRSVRARFPDLRAVGQELTEHEVEGVTIYTGPLIDVPGSYDVVTMLDVAEHVLDPAEFFSAAREKTRSLLYIHTPCRSAWDTIALRMIELPGLRGLGVKWLSTRVSLAHLRLWTPKALRMAVEGAGFEVVAMRRVPELSHPARRYVVKFLPRRVRHYRFLVAALEAILRAVVRLGLLRNKAIVEAVPVDISSAARRRIARS